MITNNPLKLSLTIAAFAVLGALSATATAQSNEYRQGYDQGYRDHAEGQGQPNHEGRIIIEEAHYGSREGGFCDPRESIQRAIGWRRHADIRADNQLCGDPAPNHVKHLEVRYRCGNSQTARAETPENTVLALSCQ
ncbi:MAG TPA: hypothetical protein VIF60_24055 [Burkholderiaceae bacterium]|jgi:hypothetical protein